MPTVSQPVVTYSKTVPKNFTKFRAKQLCWSISSNEGGGCWSGILLKRDWCCGFTMDIEKFFRIVFFQKLRVKFSDFPEVKQLHIPKMLEKNQTWSSKRCECKWKKQWVDILWNIFQVLGTLTDPFKVNVLIKQKTVN